jgi:hypothetical protein
MRHVSENPVPSTDHEGGEQYQSQVSNNSSCLGLRMLMCKANSTNDRSVVSSSSVHARFNSCRGNHCKMASSWCDTINERQIHLEPRISRVQGSGLLPWSDLAKLNPKKDRMRSQLVCHIYREKARTTCDTKQSSPLPRRSSWWHISKSHVGSIFAVKIVNGVSKAK